jgi:DNA-binding response OmpR family regulator
MRILLVDDEPTTTALLSVLLTREGHEVRTASTSTTAIPLAGEFLPAVICLDLRMPRLDGYEIARALRTNPQLDKTTIIALSACVLDQQRAHEVGIDDSLLKPVALDTLLSAIANAVRQP